VERRCEVSSGRFPPNDDPSAEEILEALREAITNNPRLDDMPVEEIARQLVLKGHLEQEPPLELVEDALDSDEFPPPYFVEDRSEPAKMELERCDACGLPSDSLGALEGDRLCDRCDAVFWAAQMLRKSDDADEEEIIATLAFAAHSKYESLRDEKTRATFSRSFSYRYSSFELVRFVEDVPVIRLRKAVAEVVRYTGSKLPRRVRLRILSKFADPDEVRNLYWRVLQQENLPVFPDSRGSVSWQYEDAHLVLDVGPREEIHFTRLKQFAEYPQTVRFSFPMAEVIAALCKALVGIPRKPGRDGSKEMFAVGLGDHGRSKRKKPHTTIPACVAWYLGEREENRQPKEGRLRPKERRPRVAKMLNRHLFGNYVLDDAPWSSGDPVWEDAREVGPRFDLTLLLLQGDTRFKRLFAK
jgi:hypothetical protein